MRVAVRSQRYRSANAAQTPAIIRWACGRYMVRNGDAVNPELVAGAPQLGQKLADAGNGFPHW